MMSELDNIQSNPFCLAVDGETLTDQNPIQDAGTGYGHRIDDVYPFPRIYSRATAAEQARRDAELNQARLDNPYNDTLLPGAVVHGNVGSPQVAHNSSWVLHGDENVRQAHAREDNIGSDDRDPGEDGIDIYESMWHYFEKNCELWATNNDAETQLQGLLAALTNNLIDNDDPSVFRLNAVDPILQFAPDGKATDVKHLDFYPPFPERYPRQPFNDEPRNDDVFAWVQVAHGSPFYRIEPYTEHLPNFRVTNDIFRQTVPFQNDDIDQAMAEGRVFIVDFKEYHQFNLREPASQSRGARFYTPIALFAVPKGSDELKTICIQCTQDTPRNEAERQAWKENNTQPADRPLSDILTPADDYWSWQMAKNVFMSMYGMSNVIDHLSMHVYLGAIPIGFYRNIPKQHPLTAILEPHMMLLVANNHTGIFYDTGTQDFNSYGPPDKGLLTGMMNKLSGWTGQTFIDATVERAKYYDFVANSTPVDRSKPNAYSAIGDFPVLDDQGLYPIIERWARNYLNLYYRYDADVVNDHELQAFCNETVTMGKVAGFPQSLSSIDELVEMVARIIYWMSVNHALEATLGLTTFAPLSYWSDRVPRNDEVKTEADWLDVMPPIDIGLAIFCASRFFVDLPREWYRSLGRYPDGKFMHDRRVYQHLDTFQKELMELDDRIQATNASRKWSYTMMRPATMTCSPWN